MATFTEAQITDLSEILGTNSDVLTFHLNFNETLITESDKTRVLELVTEWKAISTNDRVTSIEPNIRNFGTRVNTGAAASSIASRIKNLLRLKSNAGGQAIALVG